MHPKALKSSRGKPFGHNPSSFTIRKHNMTSSVNSLFEYASARAERHKKKLTVVKLSDTLWGNKAAYVVTRCVNDL